MESNRFKDIALEADGRHPLSKTIECSCPGTKFPIRQLLIYQGVVYYYYCRVCDIYWQEIKER